MVARSDLGFVLVAIQIWFGVCLGPNSNPVWVLVVYDFASLSLSLSLSLSQQTLVMDWLRFVFVILYPYEFVFVIWILVVRRPTVYGFWLRISCLKIGGYATVCVAKNNGRVWREKVAWCWVGRGAFGSLDYVPLKQDSHATHVIELSVQYNKKFNLGMQSVTKVIV